MSSPTQIIILALFLVGLSSCKDSPTREATPEKEASANYGASTPGATSNQDVAIADRPANTGRPMTKGSSLASANWSPTVPGAIVDPVSGETYYVKHRELGDSFTLPDGRTILIPQDDQEPVPLVYPKGGEHPLALPHPNKKGMAINPFTGNVVDVRGVRPGTLTRDPRSSGTDTNEPFVVPEPIEN